MECKEFKEMKFNWNFENVYIYWVRKKNYFIINERGCILVCLKKVWFIRLLFKFYLMYIGEFGFEDFVMVLVFWMW